VVPDVIGIGGVARVGKDTFCKEIMKELKLLGINSKRVAFADALKNDLKKFLLDKSGVNVYTDDDLEKKQIRPLLVEYGKLMRELSLGLYWINKLKPSIEQNKKNKIISIITDVRYPNETDWINSMPNSLSIHMVRDGITYANKEESINDPLSKEKAKIIINWKNCNLSDIPTISKSHIYERILKRNKTIPRQ
tara:strand:+ start:68 stop:646 length:579 start_codon:yes stop_codon:yes gene_type:complete